MKSAEDRIVAYPHLLRPRTFRSSDGSTLQYFDSEAGKPLLLMANGLGGPCLSFEPLARELAGTFRLASWDYRGLYGSEGASRRHLGIAQHAEDAAELLRHLGEREVYFLGWSMGVQVGLELSERTPSLSGLILLGGTVGTPLETFPLPFAPKLPDIFPFLARGGASFRAILASRHLSQSGLWIAKKLGMVADGFRPNHFDAMRLEFSRINFRTYFEILDELCRHDASAHARNIAIPALVLTGDEDRVTPPDAGRRLASLLRHAEHILLPGATHYAPAEFPQEIAILIERFYRQIGAQRLT